MVEDVVLFEEINSNEQVEQIFSENYYEAYESVEERAFHLLNDLGFWKSQRNHYAISYLDEIPQLGSDGKTYLEKISIPSHSTFEGERLTTSSYLESLPSSEISIFAEGKVGIKLGATANYFDDICAVISPFVDNQATATVMRAQPESPSVEKALQQKYAAIKNLGDRAFQILVDLCTERGSCGQQV